MAKDIIPGRCADCGAELNELKCKHCSKCGEPLCEDCAERTDLVCDDCYRPEDE